MCLALAIPVYGAEIQATEEINTETIREYAFRVVTEKWNEAEAQHYDDLIYRESSWRHDAQNPGSSAFGLPQFLDSTWSYVGCQKTTDPKIQIDCGIKYVEKVYGTPSKAISFHNKNNYY